MNTWMWREIGIDYENNTHADLVQVQGSGSRVQGPGFRVQGAGCRVQGAGVRGQGAGCKAQGAGPPGPLQGAGCRVQGAGCRVQGVGVKASCKSGYVLSNLVSLGSCPLKADGVVPQPQHVILR